MVNFSNSCRILEAYSHFLMRKFSTFTIPSPSFVNGFRRKASFLMGGIRFPILMAVEIARKIFTTMLKYHQSLTAVTLQEVIGKGIQTEKTTAAFVEHFGAGMSSLQEK